MILISLLTTVAILAGTVWVALPSFIDLAALLRPRRRERGAPSVNDGPPARLLFLIPAHDEELLIRRTLESLHAMDYPTALRTFLVVADNCTDATAERARRAGGMVLERGDHVARGKSHAIGWALKQVPLDEYDAVILIDADTIVEPDYARRIASYAPLRLRVLQTYDGMSNEFETWLTRLAGLLTRNRYDYTLKLKAKAGLNVPLTGDGSVLGTEVLTLHPWQVHTITEGWELYATYTLAGLPITYVPEARLYAQEARSLRQSGTQRQRWSAGRFAVFRLVAGGILTAHALRPLQRLDLVAELTNPGPVTRAVAGVVLAILAWAVQVPAAASVAILALSGFAHPALLSLLSLRTHPQPAATIRALAALPVYGVWRIMVAARTLFTSGRGVWVRTARHQEASADKAAPSSSARPGV